MEFGQITDCIHLKISLDSMVDQIKGLTTTFGRDYAQTLYTLSRLNEDDPYGLGDRVIALIGIGDDTIGDGQLLLKISECNDDEEAYLLRFEVLPYASRQVPSTKNIPKTFTPSQAADLLDKLIEEVDNLINNQ